MRKPRPEPEAQRETGTKLLVAMTGKVSAAKAARPWRMRSPNGLAIIPNTTHMTILGSAALTQFATALLESQ